jgi:serine/threonine-protein kinase
MHEPLSFGDVTPAGFRQIREVFEAALVLAPEARAPFIEKACSGNALLIAEVERMLAADAEPNSLLDAGGATGPRLRAGAIFAAHFHIGNTIGRGGMGEVYRGRDIKLNREVAIKVLSEPFVAHPDRLTRFKREAQLLASLNHSNIAAIYGFEESNGVHALVLELVEGPTLADRIARGPIAVDEALPIARQIAEALEAAHEMGIIHRDLKPSNIKLRADGVVKVLDFGLAKALQPIYTRAENAAASPTLTSPAVTGMGVLLGTAAYMAPEQAKGNAVDRRSDIWASERSFTKCYQAAASLKVKVFQKRWLRSYVRRSIGPQSRLQRPRHCGLSWRGASTVMSGDGCATLVKHELWWRP